MSRKLFSQQRQQSTTTATATPTALLLIFIFLSCATFHPFFTHSSPLNARTKRTTTHTKAHDRGPACAHDSVAELIKTSPVILKALGAHIFTDDDFNGMGLPLERMANELNSFRQQNEFSQAQATATATEVATPTATATTTSAASTSAMQNGNNADGNNARGSTMFAATIMPETESILITLTPETIYKGASLLKMSPGSENGARSSSFDSANAAESAATYDGQLNATLQPVHCFDGSLLQLLPTELIVFGKLITTQQQQQLQLQLQQMTEPQTPQQQRQQQQQNQQQLPHSAKLNGEDILHISINGFHRWSPQFENHIWKHLGWDDWSDFTLCSVTCGKGVQQRFRRCLLDNPMVNLNINANSNAIEVNAEGDDDIDVDGENDSHDYGVDDVDDDDDDVDADVITADNNNNNEASDGNGDSDADAETEADDDATFSNSFVDENMKITNEHEKQKSHDSKTDDELNVENIKRLRVNDVAAIATPTPTVTVTTTTTSITTAAPHMSPNKIQLSKLERNFQTMEINDATSTTQVITSVATMRPAAADEFEQLQPVTLTSDNNEHIQVENTVNGLNDDDGDVMRIESMSKDQQQKRIRKLHKKRKATKSFSTMFCEGYNIEQRNCNTFECSDDISDLLKFYKRPAGYEDVSSMSPAAVSTNDFSANIFSSLIAKTDVVTSGSIGSAAGVAAASPVSDDSNDASSASVLANSTPSTTPANMGYIRSWHNPLNFTIMLTLRVKNDSKNSATIFSIRNATHNLYLDQCQDGLRLYLERDNSTEMLPVKFNLYDYRWHQVAISIQNGDFISIYVDCSWTNSFVVSKRLFTLPLDADAEIGRGFNGELQQLLLMPDNQERHQCSNRRTSINEVKRYIIDTFIGDYGN